MGGDGAADGAGQEPDPAAIAREIRGGRGFSLADAIGRLGGAGVMKGASPIALQRQAQAAISDLLARHLVDGPGELRRVLAREVVEGRFVLELPTAPAAALRAHVEQVLASDAQLVELVRAVDEVWGRESGERPFFEREGHPPHPDDPYTVASVRRALDGLLAALPR